MRWKNKGQDSHRQYDVEAMQQAQSRRGKRWFFGLMLLLAVLLTASYLMQGRHYLLVSMLVLLAVIGSFIWNFEWKRPRAREVVLLALMTAFCVSMNELCAHTIPLHAGTAVVVLAGAGLGPQAGFLVGALSRLLCNFFDGQGPWTPWQMVTWGLLGFLAGCLFHRKKRKAGIAWLVIYTFLSVFLLYGGVMNFAAMLLAHQSDPAGSAVSKEALLGFYMTGIPYDLSHAATASFCMLLLGDRLLQKLERIQIKFGMRL